jgi:hypothetical protein
MKMANKLTDLNDRLFSQFDYLEDRNLSGEKLNEEIARSKAAVDVAQAIIANGALILSACRISDNASRALKLPVMLTD